MLRRLMFKMFKPQVVAVKNIKPRAAVFVDYEHWYISLDKMFKMKPDIKTWRDELAQKYDLCEIAVFADFSNPSLRSEISRIREVTNIIIETQNTSTHHKKDFTDFIMLDHIYQKAMTSENIDTFIIFSGDGHFSSVVSFLKNRMSKEVGVYAIKDAVSTQLRNTASWLNELPYKDERKSTYYQMILKYIKSNESSGKEKKSYPTFWATVEAVAETYRVDKDKVAEIMREMINRGYIYQKREHTSVSNSIKIICVDWQKAARDGIKVQ